MKRRERTTFRKIRRHELASDKVRVEHRGAPKFGKRKIAVIKKTFLKTNAPKGDFYKYTVSKSAAYIFLT